MDDPLRDRRFLTDLAASGQVIEIVEKIGSFDRLSKAIATDIAALGADAPSDRWQDSPVTGRLKFGFADGVATLTGYVEAQAIAVCQRCLAAFHWPLRTELRFQLTLPDAASGTRDDYELWELSDALVCPLEIVDEALVMAMPLSARHEDSTLCVEIAEQDDDKLVTPFASLRAQIEKRRNN